MKNKNNKKITTIKLEKQTKERLDKLKEVDKESYEYVIKKMLHILNLFRKNPSLANKMLNDIENARARKKSILKYTSQNAKKTKQKS
jgi:predicted DNA-binding protein